MSRMMDADEWADRLVEIRKEQDLDMEPDEDTFYHCPECGSPDLRKGHRDGCGYPVAEALTARYPQGEPEET